MAANKIDQRPFRGDWCNQNGAGIGARPTAQPFGARAHIIAFVWIKPPGESDGDYPTATHTHGDPHCDPNSTNTDGNGGTYPTGAIPGFDVPAGQWFAAQFQQLVTNAFPAIGAVAGSVTVTNPGSKTGTVGTATSLQISASDTAGGTLSYAATGLPAGLSISSSTGLISGTPTTAGTSSVTRHRDRLDRPVRYAPRSRGRSAPPGPTRSRSPTPGNQTGTVGTAASLQIHATDSASGQTLTYTATGLPAGLSISTSTGLISGTPTTAGTSSVTVTAKDTTNASGSTTFTWTVSAVGANTVTVTNPGSQTGTVGTAFSVQIHATDSASGQTLTYTATGLPAGSVDQLVRSDLRHPDHRRHLLGDRHGQGHHQRDRFGEFHLDGELGGWRRQRGEVHRDLPQQQRLGHRLHRRRDGHEHRHGGDEQRGRSPGPSVATSRSTNLWNAGFTQTGAAVYGDEPVLQRRPRRRGEHVVRIPGRLLRHQHRTDADLHGQLTS